METASNFLSLLGFRVVSRWLQTCFLDDRRLSGGEDGDCGDGFGGSEKAGMNRRTRTYLLASAVSVLAVAFQRAAAKTAASKAQPAQM